MPADLTSKRGSRSSAALLWLAAAVITVFAANYQKSSGPSYPVEGVETINGEFFEYSLPASHGGPGGQRVEIPLVRGTVGVLEFRRHNMDEPWIGLPMQTGDDCLFAELPHQPPAGKLDYRIKLRTGADEVMLPAFGNVVIRFRGAVPALVLAPHIIFMFLSLLFGTRAGLEALGKRGNPVRYAVPAALAMFLGGMLLGPVVQKYAFGEFWTGFPFGHDLTDNKTLISMIGWAAALLVSRRGKFVRASVLAAVILTWAIFLIPHSMLGSELDYAAIEKTDPAGISPCKDPGSLP